MTDDDDIRHLEFDVDPGDLVGVMERISRDLGLLRRGVYLCLVVLLAILAALSVLIVVATT